MQACRVEDGYRGVLRADEQIDLGTAEDDAFRAALDESAHDAAEVLPGLLFDDADAEFAVDDVVDTFAVGFFGRENGQAVFPKAPDVEVLLHGVSGREQAGGAE